MKNIASYRNNTIFPFLYLISSRLGINSKRTVMLQLSKKDHSNMIIWFKISLWAEINSVHGEFNGWTSAVTNASIKLRDWQVVLKGLGRKSCMILNEPFEAMNCWCVIVAILQWGCTLWVRGSLTAPLCMLPGLHVNVSYFWKNTLRSTGSSCSDVISGCCPHWDSTP